MNPWDAFAVFALGALLCTACGGRARQAAADAGADNAAGAGNAAGPSACGSVPVPKEHRAVPQACPGQAASSGPIDTSSCKIRTGITCTQDADCTAGSNGRCLAPHGEPCDTECSYDECLTDSDCPAGPCLCANRDTENIANVCLSGGNCSTDADCGNCGYCSLSYVLGGFDCNVGSLWYVCHTANDECTNSSDCDTADYCAYDVSKTRWTCQSCFPIEHP